VATFCNLTTSGPDSLARKVAAIYLADQMQPDSAMAWTVALEGEPRVAVPPSNLRGFVGVWRNDDRGEVRRTRLVGDTLFEGGSERARLVPLGGSRFRTQSGSETRFEGDATAPSRMVVRTTADEVTYVHADSAVLTAAQLAEYAGDYHSDEVEATHTWRVENGKLVVYAGYRRLGVLEPAYRDGFTRGNTVINVVRDGKGHITGFLVEAGRVRHLRFSRAR
jgi:hypothetical protein